MRLTLRTLLAYLDDTLPPAEATAIGHKVAESENARELIDKIKKLTRKRGLATPTANADDPSANPNTVAEYLSDALSSDSVSEFETACLESEINLAEISACHQILTLLLSEPARVPPTARKRMYELVKGPESLPNRKPGLTVPVGGMPVEKPKPDSGDDDAGLLLGLSPASFGLRWTIAAALMVLALVAGWFAWPRFDAPAKHEVANVVDPIPQGPNPQPPSEKPPTEPIKVAPPLAETPVESAPKPVPVTPKDPQKRDDFAIDATRKPIGKVVSKDQVILTSSMAGSWTRIADGTAVSTGNRIVCLPGYKAKVQLDTNVVVIFWGNLPEQIPNGPLEAAVVFHAPANALAADLTLHTGRIYIQTADPKGAAIRIRFAGEIWGLQLADEKTEVAVDVSHRLPKGLTLPSNAKIKTTWAIAATRGSVRVEMGTTKLALILKSDEGIDSENRPPSADVAKKLARQLVYPDAVVAATAQKALVAFASSLSATDRVRVKLAEAVDDDTVAMARIAVFGQAAIGEVAAVTEELMDANRPFVRDAAEAALRGTMANDASSIGLVAGTLETKLGLSPMQSEWIVSLLRGLDSLELRSAATLNRLVDGLTADTLPERELCHRTLILDVDPDSANVPGLTRYDPTGSVEAREACQKLWRKRVEELAK